MLRAVFERILAARFALPVMLLCAAGFLIVTESSYKVASSAVSRAERLTDNRIALQHVLRLIVDGEAAQRGYVITGREDFLLPYAAALSEMPRVLQRAQDTRDPQDPDAARRMAQLRTLVQDRLAQIDAAVTLRRSGQADAARLQMVQGAGLDQTDVLRGLIEGELARGAQVAHRTNALVDRTLLFNRLGLGALVVLSAMGLSMYMQQARRLEDERARQRAGLLAERERLEREVTRRTADLRELARHLMVVREDERAHLARELHDELGALLTAAKLDVARLRTAVRGHAPGEERLVHLTHTLDEGIALKRRIIEDLRPSSLDNLGLRTALELLCRDMAERLGVPVRAQLDDVRLGDPHDLAVYRLVQEGLTNVGKYARASEVAVTLRREAQAVWVQVRDDGRGFEPAVAASGRHGLAGMRFRVESLGGTMDVRSAPGAGTTLKAELPLPAAAPAPQRVPA